MNFLKKATDRASSKKDLNIVMDYIKAGLKTELDIARTYQKSGIMIDISDDDMLSTAAGIANEVLKDFDEIQKRTQHEKTMSLNTKQGTATELSADEEYAIDLRSLQDIKKAGLVRPLSSEERKFLKVATTRFAQLYAEELKMVKIKSKNV